VLQLLVTANVFLNTPTLATLMMEATRSSETSVLIGATRHTIPEDGTVSIFYFYLWYTFLLESDTQGLLRRKELGTLIEFNYLI
jgi:hypothetical protein